MSNSELDDFLKSGEHDVEIEESDVVENQESDDDNLSEGETEAGEVGEDEGEEKGEKDDVTPADDPVIEPDPVKLLEEKIAKIEAENAAFKKMAIDERKKRQESEKAPMPDVLENPEGFAGYMQDIVQKELLNDRLNRSEAEASKKYPDLQDKVEAFKAQASGSDMERVMSAASPYEAIYQHMQKLEKLKFLDNEDDYKARLEAQIRAKVEAELIAKKSSKDKIKSSLPESLAAKPSSGGIGVSGPANADPTPLSELFPE